jgi:membrane protein YdbS with pleckstrin-like domain
MTCPRCSADLPDGSLYCNRCGARIGGLGGARTPEAAAEEPIWTGRYSPRAAAHLFGLAGLWLAGVLIAGFAWRTRVPFLIPWGLAVVAVVPGAWVFVQTLLRRWSLRYRLTSHRLFTERGLLSRQHDELELIRVDDVSVRQSLLQRWLGVGVVTVVSTDSSNPCLVIEGIEGPLVLKEEIRARVRALRAGTTFLETL